MSNSVFSDEQIAAFGQTVAELIPSNADFGLPGADDPVIFADFLSEAACHANRLDPALIQTLCVQCYYRDPRVMEWLGMEARAPFPKGFPSVPNDVSLLEPVKARAPMFRETP